MTRRWHPTVLQFNELEWSSSSSYFSIADGFAAVTQMTYEARVSLNLVSEGFTTRVNIRCDPDELITEAMANSGITRTLAPYTPSCSAYESCPWFPGYR